ncbi:TonB family protein [Brevundimonas sp.]|uniref:TonB family protein n=1 Tax=Brevundimonas sp. TaxID=1871086 RepID=UPI002D3E6D7E|nr:TonB family protein [Brevundimonas sp.]HYC96972.1 TonB family protein [Brevundimonas sp.]
MMIRTAGGPGLVSPFDYNERKTPCFSRTTWVALAVVAAGHVGLGAALYYQRFELDLPPAAAPAPFDIEIMTPPKPTPPEAKPAPAQAPNTKYNDLPAPPTATDVVNVVQGETVTGATVINNTETAPEAIETGTTTEPVREPPAVITNPRWERQPSAEQLMRAYPDRALEAGVGGRATMNCLVQPNGRVADCNLTGETPGGHGFGRAAQGLTRHFQISPRTVNGAPEGSRVNIAIRFNPPPAE